MYMNDAIKQNESEVSQIHVLLFWVIVYIIYNAASLQQTPKDTGIEGLKKQ